MSYSSVLHQGRAAFVARMRGRCRVVTVGDLATDLGSGVVRPKWTVVHSDVPFYARYPGLAFEQDKPVAGVRLVDSRIVVRVPHGYSVPVDALIEVVSDPDNPQLVGVVFRVASLDDQSQSTAQRLLCVDAQRGVGVGEPLFGQFGLGGFGDGPFGGA